MRIDTRSLSQAGLEGLELAFSERPAAFDEGYQGYELPGQLTFEGTISETSSGVYCLAGTLGAWYRAECGRCLAQVERAFDTAVYERFEPETQVRGQDDDWDPVEGLEQEDEDSEAYRYRGHILDLTAPLLHNVYLALPTKVLCKENCLGLCPVCGKDRNVEPCTCEAEAAAEAEETDNPFAALREWQLKL